MISIDLLVVHNQKYLVGKRTINPAKNYWFVPGGRILKNESISEAFERITYSELGFTYSLEEAIFHGVFEHHHSNNFFDGEFTTHYVVLCFKIKANESIKFPDLQHSSYKWFDQELLLKNSEVHQFVKDYFIKGKKITN